MTTMTIDSDLYDELALVAETRTESPKQLTEEAIRHFLWEQRRRKIAEEGKAYRRQHAELVEEYIGRYIAMHNGQVVDVADDFTTLLQRTRARYGKLAVLLTKVEVEPYTTVTRRGFQMAATV